MVTGRGGDAGGDAAQRLRRGQVVAAREEGAADSVVARFDEVVEAETDAAVLADANGGATPSGVGNYGTGR